MEHTHELKPPQRITQVEMETYLSRMQERVAEDNLPRQHAYNKTNLQHNEEMCASLTTRQVARMRRRLEQKREEVMLQRLAGHMDPSDVSRLINSATALRGNSSSAGRGGHEADLSHLATTQVVFLKAVFLLMGRSIP
eukprot:GHVU01228758.1.p1 GENE.GHVU01228758.1~~GHVU01228758.1.p1  ORF type:complete len:138 (-),score=15.51 GHVU01228758.1:383-796(-)